jgi:polyhydroxybutyrate depolymerase
LQVGLYRIDGAGHAEPSRLKRYPRFINWLTGLQNADLEVAEAAWDFFREKRAKPDAVHVTKGAFWALQQCYSAGSAPSHS